MSDEIEKKQLIFPHDLKTSAVRFYLCDSQDGHSEDEGDGPGDHVEVGGSAGQRLVGGAQSFEGRVPGVGQHDEPDHARHQGVVHDDEDGDTRQRL